MNTATDNPIKKYGDLPPMPLSDYRLLEGAAKTAVQRKDASVPLRHLVGSHAWPLMKRAGLTWLDYGCGHGQDVRWLREVHNIDAEGWDPYWSEIFPPHPDDTEEQRVTKRRHSSLRPSDVVTMTYVINVIASEAQRLHAIHDAADHVVPGGIIMIAARNVSDVEAAARRGGWTPATNGGYWVDASKRRYQRGFTHNEVQRAFQASVLPGHWEELGHVPGTGFVGRVWRRKP